VVGETPKRGTFVRFKPDPEIFTETTKLSFETLSARLRELAFLNKGLSISITEEGTGKHHEFFFEGGIKSFVEYINSKKTAIFPEVIYFEKEDEKYMLEIALQYNDGYGEQLYSFVNNINTVEGGTHVAGFKSALTKACNKRAVSMKILKEDQEGFSSEDVREGLVAVINIKVPEPQFEGQTKGKLGNSEVKGIVDSWTFAYLDTFFEENPAIAKKVLQKAETAKHAREAAKKARDIARRKTVLESTVLPGKLADCSSEVPADTELFIVEGESAGGSAKQARDRDTQAILPLKGKILNVEKARLDKMLGNEEIKAMIAAVGCGIGEECDPAKARYHKIILMSDADVDGSHIQTLLLTFFFRYMKPIVDNGYLYIAQPPLYKAKIGRKEQYLKDEKALKIFTFDWARDNIELIINGNPIDESQWTNLLQELLTYEESLKEVIWKSFKIAPELGHALLSFLRKNPWKPEYGVEKLIESLRANFKKYNISFKPTPADAPTTPSEPGIASGDARDIDHATQASLIATPDKTGTITFQVLTKEWHFALSFFSADETALLMKKLEKLSLIEDNAGVIKIKDKDKKIETKGALSVINAIDAISKPYMYIQRYKGLGEMNPEQLWETAMDIKTRSLLSVKVEDILEADLWCLYGLWATYI